jgi:hypothetical protein
MGRTVEVVAGSAGQWPLIWVSHLGHDLVVLERTLSWESSPQNSSPTIPTSQESDDSDWGTSCWVSGTAHVKGDSCMGGRTMPVPRRCCGE